MKLLVCLLFCSNLAIAQLFGSAKDSAFVKIIDDLPSKQPFDTIQKYREAINSPYLYIISDKEVYELFGWKTSSQYREFDFGTYHIVGTRICKQCQLYCHHDEAETNCHRNVCNREWVWTMRDNKKAFTEVPIERRSGLTEEMVTATKFKYGDTVLQSADTKNAIWVTSSRGDCHASFKFGLFTDNYYPVLLLKEWNYYGGCRAGGRWKFALDFNMPPGITTQVKAVIFME